MVQTQLTSHIEDFQLLLPSQLAYRINYSTETAILVIQTDLLLAADAGISSALLLLDLSAAFDTVNHQRLLKRLVPSFGVTGFSLGWFPSYPSGRTQSVKALVVTSPLTPFCFGVS